jgi:hypothetical protein
VGYPDFGCVGGNMTEIIADGKILARLIKPKDQTKGLNFFSRNDEAIQLGSWDYGKGHKLLNHMHKEVPRTVNRTHEILLVQSGKIRAAIYSLGRQFISFIELEAGDILILLDCGHGYDILEDDTKVIEIKNGPYLGAEVDRERF